MSFRDTRAARMVRPVRVRVESDKTDAVRALTSEDATTAGALSPAVVVRIKSRSGNLTRKFWRTAGMLGLRGEAVQSLAAPAALDAREVQYHERTGRKTTVRTRWDVVNTRSDGSEDDGDDIWLMTGPAESLEAIRSHVAVIESYLPGQAITRRPGAEPIPGRTVPVVPKRSDPSEDIPAARLPKVVAPIRPGVKPADPIRPARVSPALIGSDRSGRIPLGTVYGPCLLARRTAVLPAWYRQCRITLPVFRNTIPLPLV